MKCKDNTSVMSLKGNRGEKQADELERGPDVAKGAVMLKWIRAMDIRSSVR